MNVLQATAGQCSGSSQNGDVNMMQCVDEEYEDATAHQFCGLADDPTTTADPGPIVQTGDHNELICKLIYDVTLMTPTPQCVLQEVHFDQEGTTNKFKGVLRIVQQIQSGGTQTQDARQRINGRQDAEEKNESEIEEVQIQKLTGSATAQNQNTGCPLLVTQFPAAGDCNPAEGASTPYTCLNLDQFVAAGGDNISKFKQEVKEDADTSAVTATETQGQPFTGGNDASVHQEVVEGGDSLLAQLLSEASGGKNLGIADQYTYQTLPRRMGLTQSQFEDPTCCFGTQIGGEHGEEVISQWVEQDAGRLATQDARAHGTTESSDSTCVVNHMLRNNGGFVDNSQTAEGSPCAIDIRSSCDSAGGEGSCFSTCPNEGEFFDPDTGECEPTPVVTPPPTFIPPS